MTLSNRNNRRTAAQAKLTRVIRAIASRDFAKPMSKNAHLRAKNTQLGSKNAYLEIENCRSLQRTDRACDMIRAFSPNFRLKPSEFKSLDPLPKGNGNLYPQLPKGNGDISISSWLFSAWYFEL
jgi:hypothetical protein